MDVVATCQAVAQQQIAVGGENARLVFTSTLAINLCCHHVLYR